MTLSSQTSIVSAPFNLSAFDIKHTVEIIVIGRLRRQNQPNVFSRDGFSSKCMVIVSRVLPYTVSSRFALLTKWIPMQQANPKMSRYLDGRAQRAGRSSHRMPFDHLGPQVVEYRLANRASNARHGSRTVYQERRHAHTNRNPQAALLFKLDHHSVLSRGLVVPGIASLSPSSDQRLTKLRPPQPSRVLCNLFLYLHLFSVCLCRCVLFLLPSLRSPNPRLPPQMTQCVAKLPREESRKHKQRGYCGHGKP